MYLYLAGSVLMGTAGHLLVKTGVSRVVGGILIAFLDPYVIAGIICYALSMALWLPFLSSRPVAQAVPAAGITYLLVAIASGIIRGEWLSAPQWGGILLVCFGLWLLR